MRFEETDQSQVAQPELLLAILLPVTQQVIPSLTCTSITTYVSQCVLHVLSSSVVLLLVTQQVIPSLTCTSITTYLSRCVFYILSSWAVLLPVTQQVIPSLTCTCITTYVSQCVLHILSSSVVLLLVALLVIASLTCSSICQVSESAHSVTEHHLVELLPCKSRRCFVLCCLLPRDVISQVELHKYNQVWSLHVWLVIKIKIETALQCCCPVFCCLLPSRSYPA